MVYNVASCICMEFVVRDNTPSETVSVEVSTNHIRRGGEGSYKGINVC